MPVLEFTRIFAAPDAVVIVSTIFPGIGNTYSIIDGFAGFTLYSTNPNMPPICYLAWYVRHCYARMHVRAQAPIRLPLIG